MEENLGGRTYVREMRFAGDDGVRVDVRIESPREGLRAASIRSAMVNHCSLYPVGELAPEERDTPYWRMALYGVLVVALAYGVMFALFAFQDIPRERVFGDPVMRMVVLQFVPAIFLPFSVGYFLLLEAKSRRFRRKSRALTELHAATPRSA